MLSWIESQSTSVIAGLMLAFCYAMAAAVWVCGKLLSRRTVSEELKTISPVTLTTPLVVILGLLIGFIAARVWANVAKAKEHVEQEATALSESYCCRAPCHSRSEPVCVRRSEVTSLSSKRRTGR